MPYGRRSSKLTPHITTTPKKKENSFKLQEKANIILYATYKECQFNRGNDYGNILYDMKVTALNIVNNIIEYNKDGHSKLSLMKIDVNLELFRELAKDACKLGIIGDKAKKFYLDIGEEIGKITGTLIKNRPDGKRKYKQTSGESSTSELSPEVKDPLMRMAAEHQNVIGAD